MHNTKRLPLFIAFLTLFLAALPVRAAHAAAADAGNYVEALGNQTLTIIGNPQLNDAQKQTQLERIFADNIDFPWISRFVMGRFWRQATDEQKTRYMAEHQKFLTLHYTSRFIEYTSGTFKVTGSRQDSENEYTVNMQIRSGKPGDEPVLVDYRVRQNEPGELKIFDVIVEGVSMITTQRSEFASVISQRGIDHLINQLAAKSAAGAT